MTYVRILLLVGIFIYALTLLVSSFRKRKWSDFLIAVFIITLVIMTRYVGVIIVDGPSMQPNYKTGDIMIVMRSHLRLERYDVIILLDGPRKIIKRVVGLGGESIAMQDGVTYINDEMLVENFQFISGQTTMGGRYIPIDSVFALGDNRANSYDSRIMGSVPRENIYGRMLWHFPHLSPLLARWLE